VIWLIVEVAIIAAVTLVLCAVASWQFRVATIRQNRFDRLAAEKKERMAEDVYWQVFRTAEYLQAMLFTARRLDARRRLDQLLAENRNGSTKLRVLS